jgi:radical SAM superfamily enzyme YgiQ (UPF0313 family)
MNKKILLFFPNTSNEGVMPLAVSILSSIAKKLGHTVRYFETSFYEKEYISTADHEKTGEFKRIDRANLLGLLPYENMLKDFNELLRCYKPDILAVSANSLEYQLFSELIQNVTFNNDKPFIIIGGVHATLSPDEVISNPFVDAVCRGEGEKTWEEFLTKFEAGGNLNNILNLWIKQDGAIYKNALRPLLREEELWSSPLDFDLFGDRHFLYFFDGVGYKKGNIELSRGCPYTCTYCVNAALKKLYHGRGKFMRIRPMENIKKAIAHLISIGCTMLFFQDESFFSIPYRVLEDFCSWYRDEIRLPFLIVARPESVTESKVKLLAEMQLPFQVSIGVESGSKRILEEICNRKTSVEDIKNCVRILKKYDIRITAFTMIGFPSETREEAFMTIDLVRSLDIDNSVMSIFFPFHGVPLRDYCIKNGLITGTEKVRTFTDKSILKNQPMTPDEMYNIRRTYSLYTKLPEEYYPDIQKCEKDYDNNVALFDRLVTILYDKYYKSWKLT